MILLTFASSAGKCLALEKEPSECNGGLLCASPSQLSGYVFIAAGVEAFQARLAQVLQRSVDSPGQLCELPVP